MNGRFLVLGVVVMAALGALLLSSITAAPPAQAQGCQYTMGFRAIYDQIPDDVGPCVTNEQYDPDGNSHQQTANGLMEWRKADNFTAFTDGYRSWVNGPCGLEMRLNAQRFPWEANSEGLPVVSSACKAAPQAQAQAQPLAHGKASAVAAFPFSAGSRYHPWHPSKSSPGVSVTLESGDNPLGSMPLYKWRLEGFPPDKTYGVYLMSTGRQVTKLFDGYHLGDRGFQDVSFITTRFVRGEPLAVAAMSDDGSVKGYGVVIPFPIEATGDGGCRMGAELMSTDGTKWAMYGEGFEPGEDVAVTMQLPKGKPDRFTDKANADGTLDEGLSADMEGAFSITAQGRSCTVTLEFPWGKAGMQHP
ncbi:MAG: hypothetical protein U0641_12590 [Anaerolineae bacterium]